jgi:hypothetical protein
VAEVAAGIRTMTGGRFSHVVLPKIPEVESGTGLKLRPEEFRFRSQGCPGRDFNLSVSTVNPRISRVDDDGQAWVLVSGHDYPHCSSPENPIHRPCVELMVRVDVLTEAARR